MGRYNLKPCPFCGEVPVLYGQEIRDYIDNEQYTDWWADGSRKHYWVEPRCKLTCIFTLTHSKAYGVVGGVNYKTPEAAVKAWNRRFKEA